MKKQLLTVMLTLATMATAQNPNPIKVNQVGYGLTDSKTAAIEEVGWAKTYTLTNEKGKRVWKGAAVRTAESPWSKKKRAIVDFSEVTMPGTYTLSNGKDRQTVIIAEHPLEELTKASIKAFYLQRSGEAITAEYAGQYARPMGHPDNKVMIHPSAASEARPAGTIISSPGGWYDAGDYNKYIVNSAYSIGIMLSAYEMNPKLFDAMKVGIPESNNSMPDLLDEIAVNLRWMLTMQDPADGGVYHKLTTPNFEGFVKPTDCHQQRYVVMKSTAATLDFAATMAKAYRIYSRFPECKAWAEEMLKKAKCAYEWAAEHRDVMYRQEVMNRDFDPDVQTGTYGDMNVRDEFMWAEAELFMSTREELYAAGLAQNYMSLKFSNPSWGNVMGLAYFSAVAALREGDMPYANELEQIIREQITTVADGYLSTLPNSCFDAPCGNSPRDFGWGCNGEQVCGKGVILMYAYEMTRDSRYLNGAKKVADYLLGRNATGYCFVTGFGNFSPMHPHHRLSESDGIEAPLPGFLVGGPNPGQQDKAEVRNYPSNQPDESYSDTMQSYASNEIAINWNAALVAFLGMVQK
ncbi:MAG: glycoside hydrolase family 9 protein [Bacteroidaceae bacterium]|nr:glycoside hydrolase family 9 protein [Bacteroidaceae bacterium]